MANSSQKNGVDVARFRFRRKEYQKSLRTRDRKAADLGLAQVELTVHRLTLGLIAVPAGIDPGDFVVSGGTLAPPADGDPPAVVPTLWDWVYLSPPEIAGLPALVKARARREVSHVLYAVPADTGMRRGEVLRLTWDDVEFDRDAVVARSRKQSRQGAETARRIDLHPELKAVLLDWRAKRPRGQFVACDEAALGPLARHQAVERFGQPLRGTPWAIPGCGDRLKIGFHTLRHSFASNLAAAGVDARVIDEFMGHQTVAVRKRYSHCFPAARRSAIATFSLATPAGPASVTDGGSVRAAENGGRVECPEAHAVPTLAVGVPRAREPRRGRRGAVAGGRGRLLGQRRPRVGAGGRFGPVSGGSTEGRRRRRLGVGRDRPALRRFPVGRVGPPRAAPVRPRVGVCRRPGRLPRRGRAVQVQ